LFAGSLLLSLHNYNPFFFFEPFDETCCPALDASFFSSLTSFTRLKAGCEVPKERDLIHNLHPPDYLAVLMDLKDSSYHIIPTTLGVDPARDGRPDEFHWSRNLLTCLRIFVSK
jgi:hypothetical protein